MPPVRMNGTANVAVTSTRKKNDASGKRSSSLSERSTLKLALASSMLRANLSNTDVPLVESDAHRAVTRRDVWDKVMTLRPLPQPNGQAPPAGPAAKPPAPADIAQG